MLAAALERRKLRRLLAGWRDVAAVGRLERRRREAAEQRIGSRHSKALLSQAFQVSPGELGALAARFVRPRARRIAVKQQQL